MNRLANPVLAQELRGRMRGSRAFVILTIYLLVLAGVVTLIYLAAASSAPVDQFAVGPAIGRALFLGTTFVALLQVGLIVPSQAANAIASEKERQTYDLLILTMLSPWKIVVGKLMAALTYALLLIVAVIPFMALSFFFGGVTGLEVVLALEGLLVTAVLFGSLGIFWSALMRRPMAATITATAVNVALVVGIPFLVYVFGSIFLFDTGRLPAWASNPFFVYAWIAFVSVHPLFALGGSEAYLSSGETRLFFPPNSASGGLLFLPSSGPFPAGFLVPHPWLMYTIEGLLLSALFIWLSVRLLKPLNEGAPKRKRGTAR